MHRTLVNKNPVFWPDTRFRFLRPEQLTSLPTSKAIKSSKRVFHLPSILFALCSLTCETWEKKRISPLQLILLFRLLSSSILIPQKIRFSAKSVLNFGPGDYNLRGRIYTLYCKLLMVICLVLLLLFEEGKLLRSLLYSVDYLRGF